MIKTVIHTVIIYFLLVLTVRLMGKRELGELQLSEVIATILLSEIAAAPIINTDTPIYYTFISVGIILLFEIVIPILMYRFSFLKRIFESKPSYIIYKGELSQSELKRNRLTIEELLASLHGSGVYDISELEYLILEPNGQLSAVPKAEFRGATVGDVKTDPKENGIAHALVIDGKKMKNVINKLGITDAILDRMLAKYGADAKGTFLLTIDDSGETYFIPKKTSDEMRREKK